MMLRYDLRNRDTVICKYENGRSTNHAVPDPSEDKLAEHKIEKWRAVLAAGGSCKISTMIHSNR